MAASVISSFYTAALTICLFSAGLLGRERAQANCAVSWLSWFLILEAATFALELLMIHPDTPLKGLWLGLRLGSAALIGPFLWLAVREIVEGVRPLWRDMGRRHLAAIGLAWLMTVPLMADAHWGTGYANHAEPTSWFHSRFIHATMLVCIGIFAVQAPVFLLHCRRLLEPSGSSGWLRFLLLIVGSTWVFGILRTLQCMTGAPAELFLVFALFEAGTTVGAIYVLIRQSRLSTSPLPAPAAAGLPLETASIAPGPISAAALRPGDPVVVARTATPYARSSLTPVIRERIQRKLKSALGQEHLHRDSALNLRSLAGVLRENPHYVSQVLNQDLKSSFYDLVNRYRVEEAKDLLKDSPDRTTLDIALAVGFNSKSTFNTAFRRLTGMTPSEWRAQAIEQAGSEKKSG